MRQMTNVIVFARNIEYGERRLLIANYQMALICTVGWKVGGIARIGEDGISIKRAALPYNSLEYCRDIR
jgi:hypothetical protein